MKKLSLALLAAGLLNAGVVATYNGKNVTDEEIGPIPLQNGSSILVSQMDKDTKLSFLQEYFFDRSLLAEAKGRKMENDAEFKKALEDVRNRLLVQIMQKRDIEAQKVGPAEVEKFYAEHKDKEFAIPKSYEASHILVKTEAEAVAILNELKAVTPEQLGSTFAAKAKQVSIDPSAKELGGALGRFTAEQMVPEFSQAVAGMKVGELSAAPIKTQFGFHVIYKTQEHAASTIALEDVKADIESVLKVQKYENTLKAKRDVFIKGAKIELK